MMAESDRQELKQEYNRARACHSGVPFSVQELHKAVSSERSTCSRPHCKWSNQSGPGIPDEVDSLHQLSIDSPTKYLNTEHQR